MFKKEITKVEAGSANKHYCLHHINQVYYGHFVFFFIRTTQFKYIDAFDKGRLITPNEVLAQVPLLASQGDLLLSSCEALQVFQRMIRNIMNVAQMQANISDHMELYCPATELLSLLTPTDHSVQELLLRLVLSFPEIFLKP